jgi:hypothetical protein
MTADDKTRANVSAVKLPDDVMAANLAFVSYCDEKQIPDDAAAEELNAHWVPFCAGYCAAWQAASHQKQQAGAGLVMANGTPLIDYLKDTFETGMTNCDWTEGYEECKRHLFKILGPQLSAQPPATQPAPQALEPVAWVSSETLQFKPQGPKEQYRFLCARVQRPDYEVPLYTADQIKQLADQMRGGE